MYRSIRVLMCLLVVTVGLNHVLNGRRLLAAPAAAKKPSTANHQPSGKKENAPQLLKSAKKALAYMLKHARADKALDAKTPKNKPFYAATKKIATQLDRAEKGLAAKNNDFFTAISDARAAEEQMKIAWQLTDSKNKEVIDGGKKLGHALAILRTDFSKEAARKKKGGPLSDKEKAEFAKIKTQQKDLLAKIKTLEGKAKKDKALEHGLHKMQHAANRIVKAPDTVDGFIATLYLIDELEGMLYGYDYYIDREWRGDWIKVDTYVSAWETTYSEFVSVETYEWASVETSVDVEVSEDVEISEDISETEIEQEESWAEQESFDMSDAEEDEVATEEDSDAEVDSDDADDEDSMDDSSDDDGEDFDGDGDDDGGDDDDGGGDDDDGGGDDDGGDDGE